MSYFFEHIKIPENIQVCLKNGRLVLSREKNSLFLPVMDGLELSLTVNFLKLGYKKKETKNRQFKRILTNFSTCKKKINNAIFGLTFGYCTQINLEGVGYKTSLINSKSLLLKLGNSHDIHVPIPQGVTVFSSKGITLTLKSFSKEVLGNFVADLERLKVPNVYDNKGVIIKGKFLLKKNIKKK